MPFSYYLSYKDNIFFAYLCVVKNLYIETYGCQMNVNDTEVVFSILGKMDTYARRILRRRM